MTKTKELLLKLGRKIKGDFDVLILLVLLSEWVLLNMLKVKTTIGVTVIVISLFVALIFCMARAVEKREKHVIRKNSLLILSFSDYNVVAVILTVIFTIAINMFSPMEMHWAILSMVFGGLLITTMATLVSGYFEDNELKM